MGNTFLCTTSASNGQNDENHDNKNKTRSALFHRAHLPRTNALRNERLGPSRHANRARFQRHV